jgi:hypothetical protein
MWFRRRKEKVLKNRPALPVVYLHESCLLQTTVFLRQKTDAGISHERVVYWAGKQGVDHLVITTGIAPHAVTSRGSFRTSARANADMIGVLAARGIEIIAQVHTHPGDYVDHSEGDNEDALMPFQGFLSVVVPSYARRGVWPLTRCGVHRFEHGNFRRLSSGEVACTFRLVPAFHQLR